MVNARVEPCLSVHVCSGVSAADFLCFCVAGCESGKRLLGSVFSVQVVSLHHIHTLLLLSSQAVCVLQGFVVLCSPVLANAGCSYSMTTAASAHLVLLLANENGGGFSVQPGQQQAGGTAHSLAWMRRSNIIRMLQDFRKLTNRIFRPSLAGPSSGHPVRPGGGCMPGALL